MSSRGAGTWRVGRTRIPSFQQKSPEFGESYKRNFYYAASVRTPGPAVGPVKLGPRPVWGEVMRQPDTTGSWNKHGYNMAFVTCGEAVERKRGEEYVRSPLSGPLISQTPSYPQHKSQSHDVTTCSTAAGENPPVSSCARAACGFAAQPKAAFPRAAPRFPTGSPPRMTGKTRCELHIWE